MVGDFGINTDMSDRSTSLVEAKLLHSISQLVILETYFEVKANLSEECVFV